MKTTPWTKGRTTGVGQVYDATGKMICDVLTNVDDLNMITAAPLMFEALTLFISGPINKKAYDAACEAVKAARPAPIPARPD